MKVYGLVLMNRIERKSFNYSEKQRRRYNKLIIGCFGKIPQELRVQSQPFGSHVGVCFAEYHVIN